MNHDEKLILTLGLFIILSGITGIFDTKWLQIPFLFLCVILGGILIWEATK